MRSKSLSLAALAALAALINLHAPTVFFDSQLMLGTAVAVLALLLFGWSGLLVGAAALAVTVVRWGHPFELLIGMGLLIWLRWFLDRFNGGRAQQANGRIVLAAIGYWLVVGIPAECLLFNRRFAAGPLMALSLGLKEAVVSVLCTALALLAYMLWRSWRLRGRGGRLSARSLTFAVVLLAVSLPGVLITFLLSGQLRSTAMASQHGLMVDAARDVAVRQALPATAPPRGKAILFQRGAGPELSTDPPLFARLQRDYVLEVPSRTGRPGLDLLVPSRRAPVVESDSQSYWKVRFGPVTVVQPAEPLIRRLDYEQ